MLTSFHEEIKDLIYRLSEVLDITAMNSQWACQFFTPVFIIHCFFKDNFIFFEYINLWLIKFTMIQQFRFMDMNLLWVTLIKPRQKLSCLAKLACYTQIQVCTATKHFTCWILNCYLVALIHLLIHVHMYIVNPFNMHSLSA